MRRVRLISLLFTVTVLVLGLTWTGILAQEGPVAAEESSAPSVSDPVGPDSSAWRGPQSDDIPPEALLSSASIDQTEGPAASPEDVAAEAALLPQATWKDLRVSGAVFRPRGSGTDYDTAGSGSSCIYNAGGVSTEVFNAPVFLPNGATVTGFRMYYYDTSTSSSMGWFTVYDLYGDIVQEWSVSSSGSSGNGFVSNTAFTHTIDYSQYSYVLNWRANATGSSQRLCGFRIFYEPPPFGVNFLPYSAR